MNAGRRLLFAIIIIFSSIMLHACENRSIDENMSTTVEDFAFKNQHEETRTLNDLKGDWWLAFLSYTSCTTVCPRTTANMADIQKQLKEDDLHPHIISFNVDPDNDTPEDLQQYAKKYEVDLATWDFLTGYDFETIQHLSKKTFRAGLEKGDADQISHSYMFYLINPDGEVVKKYDGMGKNDIDTLIDDVTTVLK